MPSNSEIRKQSEAAYGQWCEQWREHAKFHSRFEQKNMEDFRNSGIGRAVLAVANGYSLEENIETIKKYQDRVDIICVDKCLKSLIDHGITPNYVIVCDANVNYEKYLQPVKDKLENVTLFINVCANPKWSSNGNWKDIRFFVNQDILKSEQEFSGLSGCMNFMPAGTNVSNAQIILLTQSDNNGKNNFFGYDKILTIGYDYCWDDRSYYAFDKTGDGRANYMKTIYCYNQLGNLVYTSTNLLFSAKWFDKYVKTFKLPVIQCTKHSLVSGMKHGDLAEQMQYEYRPEDSKLVRNLLELKAELFGKLQEIDQNILRVGREHYLSLVRSI